MLRNIEGRIEDFILTADGRYISPWVVIYRFKGLIPGDQYKIIQESDLSIRLLLKADEGRHARGLKKIQHHCWELFGDTRLTIQTVDRIEEKGKFRLVESRAVG